ncbi:MAG: pyridoxal-phosphate dependent enzyme [Alphaproteobacteria bacterium]|nr:MAG: pyridoxal-phosphate dependent enzyme [Alphaproteobacteria bacterium]
MARIIDNPWRRAEALPEGLVFAEGKVVASPERVMALLARCPEYAPTPLVSHAGLAEALGLDALLVKDERGRMGLGSFKALGAAFVVAQEAEAAGGRLEGRTFVTSSAGNHGLSLAAGARPFGARAVIYLSENVPAGFAARLREMGAEVVIEGQDYEASLEGAIRRARAEGWTLVSDSTWEGYAGGIAVMEGYTALAAEIAGQTDPVDQIFLQAGVGGLAAAVTAHLRAAWGDGPEITIVEPEAAPALFGSIEAGAARRGPGPVSSMGRLDCKDPSLAALETLARAADRFVLVSEDEGRAAAARLAEAGLATSPSGGAGLAGLEAARAEGRLPEGARALIVLSEGPADD